MEGPPEILEPGTNMLTLLRRKPSRGDRRRYPLILDELVVEDAEAPRREAVSRVEVVTEDQASAQSGLLVDRPGTVAHLLDLPSTADRLEVGIVCRGGGSDSTPRFRVAVESDRDEEVLLEGEAAYGRLRRDGASLADFAGAPVRLGLEITRLAPGASCIWVEPRVVEAEGRGAESPGGGLRVPGANLIVVILDAARRDRFGLYGSAESATPAIDALARESVVFDRAYTQATYTLASTASLFTSRLPPVHGLTRSNVRYSEALSPAIPTLSEKLKEVGYATAMFSGNPNGMRLGLSRGFGEVQRVRSAGTGVALAADFQEPVLEWVDQNLERPFFLYVHLVQPHRPYDKAPERFYRGLDPDYQGLFTDPNEMRRRRGPRRVPEEDLRQLERLYEGNLRYPDWAVSELVAALRRRGVLERSVFVLSSDHGESLGERRTFGHGLTVDRELVPIPLLVRLPSRLGLAGRRDTPVGNIDVLPTLLGLFGVPVPDGIDGHSFLDLLEGRPNGSRWPRPVLSWAGWATAPTVAVYNLDFKYRFDSARGEESLFAADEEEDGANVREDHPVSFDYLAFSSYLPDVASDESLPAGEAAALDAEALEALRTLGYVE
jgi:arylsulfatase A-like enzyme